MTTKPNPHPCAPLSSLTNTLTLADDPQERAAIARSAQIAASEYRRAMQGFTPEERRRIERYANPTTSTDDVLLRKAELLERHLCPERKDALYQLKNMRVSEMVIVDIEHTNHMRVACQYNKRKFGKQYRTDTMTLGARSYLRIVRIL